MSWFDDGIEEGTWHGLIVGVHNKLDWLITDGQEFLKRSSFTPLSPKEKGILKALVELKYLKRKWWIGPHIRTEKKFKGE